MFKSLLSVLAIAATLAEATPTWKALQEYEAHLPKSVSKHQGTRPKVSIGPKHPAKPIQQSSPPRGRNCYVSSHGDGTDDSDYILDAIHKCNNGGHVIFSQGTQYVIGTALDLTFLNAIDIGKLSCTANAPLEWFSESFNLTLQSRHPRLHSVHQRYRLLAEERLLPDLPECYHLLPARRHRRKRLWRRHH